VVDDVEEVSVYDEERKGVVVVVVVVKKKKEVTIKAVVKRSRKGD